MSRWMTVVLLAIMLGSAARAQGGPSAGVIAGESGGALLGGVLGGGVCGAGLAVILFEGTRGIWRDDLLGAVVGGIAGVLVGGPLGCAAGVTLVGNACGQGGRFWPSYVGALIGVPVGGGLAYGAAKLGYPVLGYIGLLAPPAGAVIGYNLSTPRDDWSGRLLLAPQLGLAPSRSGPKSLSCGLSLRLAI